MSAKPVSLDLDRRSFMKASALAGGLALGGGTAGHVLAQSDGEADGTDDEGELTKTVCNYCAVGCGFRGEREGNAFVGQEPWHENPINNGSLCSKGAGIYGSEHSERRLKHPLQKVDGEWRKISWNEAYDHIASELNTIVEEDGTDATMWLGSAHHSNEEAYAFRKFASMFGTNNVDHQARICHSTTVAGLANTWGYGAMTNTINDYRNFDLNVIIGQNPAEAHPIAMQHILEGQKRGGKIAVVDPRFTKTAAHANEFFRMRPGTDVALMMGLIRYLREQGELDREMLDERVFAWEDLASELDRYDLETVADITWMSVEEIQDLGDMIIEAKPSVQIEWAMGGTQHNNGTQNIRSYAALSLGSGSAARSGGGLQVMRGHANVQGATDLAVASHILPGYYGVGSRGSWEYWSDVWNRSPFTSGSTDFDTLYDRFSTMPRTQWREQGGATDASEMDRSLMFQNGLTVARWFEGALPRSDRLNETPLYQENQLRAAFFWGHSANSISEMGKMQQAMQNLDLLVVVDVFPSVASVLPDRDDGVIILPASSQYEHYRSLTNSHRSIQWSEPVRPPSHNSRPDLQILQELAAKLGEYDYWDGLGAHFDWGSGPNIHNGKSTYEEVIREINIGLRTIGYIQSPERLQQHIEYDYAFSTETLKAEAQGLPVSDEFWGLPWPCWGEGHPGTPIIWNDDMDPRNGGQDFRARWGTQSPTPDDWESMNTDKEYPMQATVDAKGVEEGTNLLRDQLVPENWDSDYNGVINGVPEYPGWKTVLPEDLTNPDALSLPYQYALDPNESVYTLAQELVRRGMEEHVVQPGMNVEESLDWWEQYDYRQPDAPTGRGRARATVWNFIDTVPVHREPIESPRADLVEQWPANGQQKNFYRFDQNNSVTQEDAMQKVADQGLNTIMTTGRQVEHQGGGAETRSNEMTADLQPHMYAEITPATADDLDVDGGDMLIVSSTDRGSILVKARVTDRPNDSETFLPFHWGGVFKGQSLEDRYPEGTVPYAIGDSVNAITSRGYDVETQMQETKVSMVRLEQATEQRMEELNMEVIDFPQDREGLGLQKDFDVRDFETVQ